VCWSKREEEEAPTREDCTQNCTCRTRVGANMVLSHASKYRLRRVEYHLHNAVNTH